jgi:spore germination cell wall hydrolase CwlJ-like protein
MLPFFYYQVNRKIMFILKKLRKLSKVLAICLVFGSLSSITATLQAETNPKQSQTQTLSNKQIECLKINAYMEARNQGVKGMQAVTWVVLNRTKHPSYPSTPCAVIYAPFQFEWTRNGKTPQVKERDAYMQAERVVEGVLSGKLKDNTNASTHFHSTRIKPVWASRLSYTTTIGSHCFYKLKK